MGRIKILNKFEINHRTRRDPLKAEIEAVEQFKDSGSLALYTDAGVSLKRGRATYRIIISDGAISVRRKILLPKLDPKGATTGETLQLAVGL